MIALAPDPLTELLDLYLLHRDIAEGSIEQLRISSRAFSRWYVAKYLAPLDLAECFRDDVVCSFLFYLRDDQELSPKTVNNKRGDVITLWKFAKRRGLCQCAPEDVVRFREPAINPDGWFQDELAQLLTACRAYQPRRPIPGWDGRHWAALALVIYYTAFRIGATIALKRSQLRPDGSIIADAVAQKTFCDDIGWLGPDALRAVEATFAPGDERQLIFPWPYRFEALWYHWRRILKAAGLPSTRRDGPQKMRRTSASWMEHFRPGSATEHLGHKTPGLARKNYIDKRIASTDRKASEVLPRIGAQRTLF